MKLMKHLRTALLALAGLAFLAPSVKAAYSDGQLYLGFYMPGKSQDYLLSIGDYSSYTTNGKAFTGSSFTIGNASQIAADLTTVFGASWFGNVRWGVIGMQDGLGANTVFVTDPSAVGSTSQWTPDTSSAQQLVNPAVTGLGSGFVPNGNSATSPIGAIQTVALTNSWGDWTLGAGGSGNLAAFNSFNNNGKGIDGTAGTIGMFEMVATDASSNYGNNAPYYADGTVTKVGSFTLASNGGISYAAAVPEPSTFAVLAGGAALLGLSSRRRKASV